MIMPSRLCARALLTFAASIALAGCQGGGDQSANAGGNAGNGSAVPAAPQVATELEIVRSMIELAGVTPNDLVVDLGSGDGRIPIMAATSKGARGLGVEIDRDRISEATANAAEAGVADKVQFRQQDLFVTPLHDVTVLTLFLLPEINLQLRGKILTQMRPGTRVVSNTFDMGDWRPDRRQSVGGTNIFLWIVPAQIGGSWRIEGPAGAAGELALTQTYQDVSGALDIAGRSAPLGQPQLSGDRISFSADLGQGQQRYEGRVQGNVISGDSWRATRSTGG
jgi:SAM-dependent methyltransferase